MSVLRMNRLALRLVDHNRVSVVYDPQTKKKYRYLERYKILDKYNGLTEVYISFTSIPKLGINPRIGYNTPVGVYAYPVSYVVDGVFDPYENGMLDFRVPFPAVDRQIYLHIFEVKNIGKALYFSEDDTTVLKRSKSVDDYRLEIDDLELIQDVIQDISLFFDETQDEIKEIEGKFDSDESKDKYSAWLGKCNKILEQADVLDTRLYNVFYARLSINYYEVSRLLDPSYRTYLYDDMEKAAFQFLAEKKLLGDSLFPHEADLKKLVIPSLIDEDGYYKLKKKALSQRVVCDEAFIWNMTRNLANENPARWTGLMRQLGIIGAVDHDTGTIHPSEPTQAVFFDPRSIKVLEVIYNERPKQHKDVWADSAQISSEFSSWALNSEQNLKLVVQQAVKIIDNLSMKLKVPGAAYPGMVKAYMKNIIKILGWIHTNARNADDWYPLKKSLMTEMEILSVLVKRADIDIPPEMDRVMQMLSR